MKSLHKKRTAVSTKIISLPNSLLMSKQKSRKTVITTDTLSPDQDPGTAPGTSSFYIRATPCQTGPADSNTCTEGLVDITVPALQPRPSDSSFKVLCYSACVAWPLLTVLGAGCNVSGLQHLWGKHSLIGSAPRQPVLRYNVTSRPHKG